MEDKEGKEAGRQKSRKTGRKEGRPAHIKVGPHINTYVFRFPKGTSDVFLLPASPKTW